MDKITPFLCFNGQAEEAVRLYLEAFMDSKIMNITRLTSEDLAALSELPKGERPEEGSARFIQFQLAGQEMMAANGLAGFKFTPAVSLFVNCETAEELDAIWEKLSASGMVLMERDRYPFSERFGWLADRFGVSWQLNLGKREKKIIPFLMFVKNGKAKEAVEFYTSFFKNSEILTMQIYGKGEEEPEGTVRHSIFKLEGQELMAIDSARDHQFSFSNGISLYVSCENQDEVDALWERLSERGEKQECGWLKDRYGVSWQVAPKIVWKMVNDPNPGRAQRALSAVAKMKKLDIDTLNKAYEGDMKIFQL